MDKNINGYTDLVTEVDELVKKICAMATDTADDTTIRRDLNSIVVNRLTEAYRMRQEAEEEARKAKAAEEFKEKLIDLVSTYIVEVNPTSGGRARRTLIENYANLTIKMMKDSNSALYKVEAPKETAEPAKSNMANAVEDAASALRDAFNAGANVVDDAMLRAWVRRL